MVIFAALALNLSISGHYTAARQPPSVATQIVCCVVRTLQLCDAATQRLPLDRAMKALGAIAVKVDGFAYLHIACEGTPVVLLYARDEQGRNGPFAGVALSDSWLAFAANRGMRRRLQGYWDVRGVVVDCRGGLRVWPRPYGAAVIQGDLLIYGTNYTQLAVPVTFARRSGFDTVAAAYPHPADAAVLATCQTPWTARRWLIPCGDGYLTVSAGGRAFDVSYWCRKPGY